MSKIIFTIILGILIGIIDILPMTIKKLNRQSIVSAFLQYFFVTIITQNSVFAKITIVVE